MTPFSVAGVQMYVSGTDSNIPAMGQLLDLLMLRFPWVQMVVFSELCAFGPNPAFGQPLKSFRNRSVDFSVYRNDGFDHGYLQSLGTLEKPRRPVVVPATEHDAQVLIHSRSETIHGDD